MAKIFNRTSTETAKKTLTIFKSEILKDKSTFLQYLFLIPLNRLLYVVLLPLVFSLIIQTLITEPKNWHQSGVLLLVGVGLSLLALLTSWVGFQKLFNHEEKMRTRLTERAIQALMSHSDQFFANRKVGSLAGDVNTFGGSIVSFLDIVFLQSATIVVNFTASLIIIGIMSPILLIPLGLITAIIVWRSFIGTANRGPLRHERKTLTARLNGTVADILGNQQVVRYFAGAAREVTRVVNDRREIEALAKKEIDVIHSESLYRQSSLFTFQIITMGICIWLAASDNISIAALVFAVTYLGRLTGSLFDITPIIRGTEQVFLDASNITEILEESPEVKDADDATSLSVSKGKIEFKNVDFSYSDDDTPVIKRLSTIIKPGERVGLAGQSGGGKTTLTKLVLRFADVTGGSITIDGQDIRTVTQESLRRNIAYVPQEPYLFHRSLRDNIAYGNPDVSDDEVWKAIQQANAGDFVNALPGGLDTIVGERGIKLSGGQRQRIAIARAILKNAPILVLDEATSALDSESEKMIQEALEKLMKNRTSIVVAHRLSTIAHLDRIIVIDKGTIVEDASHTELVKKQGIYAKLWSHQSGGFIEE